MQCNADLKKPDKICNPKTGRWVLINGSIGKKLVIEYGIQTLLDFGNRVSALPAPTLSSSASSTSSSAKEPELSINPDNYDLDWRKYAIKDQLSSGYHVLKLPKGTILYKGTSADIGDKMTGYGVHGLSGYYGTLNTALWYAFSGDTRRGEAGKVITVKTLQDLYLLDMNNPMNYMLLRKQRVPVIGEMDILKYAFDDGKRRFSLADQDKIFTEWICSGLDLDGWALMEMDHWPDEILICKENMVTRLPWEFRFSGRMDERFIFLTEKGRISGHIPIPHLKGKAFKYVKFGQNEYDGVPGKQSDRFLFLEYIPPPKVKYFETPTELESKEINKLAAELSAKNPQWPTLLPKFLLTMDQLRKMEEYPDDEYYVMYYPYDRLTTIGGIGSSIRLLSQFFKEIAGKVVFFRNDLKQINNTNLLVYLPGLLQAMRNIKLE